VAEHETDVLICGAGPCGLALAVELGMRGVRCTVIERNDRVGYAPRAKTTHTRTREHLRRWGIAGELATAAPFGVDYPSNIVFVTRLAGHHLTTIENAFNCHPAKNELYSEHAQWVPQYRVEEVLRRHAETLPSVRILFDHELVGAEQDEAGVRCRMSDLKAGAERVFSARYLVGADGARSVVRELIGATMEGAVGLGHAYNIVFRAPGLAEAHKHPRGIMYWQLNRDAPGVIGPMDTGDLWYFMPARVPDAVRLDNAAAADLIRRATGIDLPYEVLSADEWTANQLIADRYRDRRLFLIGDACHLHPPLGGWGMNMGVSDAVDLGWKLAARLQGWGGERLLESYEPERRPVHRFVVDEAAAIQASLSVLHLMRPELEHDTPEGEALRRELGAALAAGRSREFRSLGVLLGYRYEASPVIASEPGSWPPQQSHLYEPTARPGALAPHAWLGDDRSLYDTFGPGFTLLAFGEAAAGALDAAKADAAAASVPLATVSLDDPRLAALYERPLALIRPDQHVAWRGDGWPGAELLHKVTGKV
jgi:2-polyprenyl-6-methoxyphenol hydroxylase-like FAD-dependent oxidoreductase